MIPTIGTEELLALFPIFGLLGFAAFSLIIEVTFRERARVWNGLACMVGVFAVLVFTSLNFFGPILVEDISSGVSIAGSLLVNRYGDFFTILFLISMLFALALELVDDDIRCGETYCLTLLSGIGMIVMATGLDLFTILLGLELMSLSIYALVGVKRTDLLSNEAALKYFLLGAFASGFFLMGIAWIYAASGSIYLQGIAQAFSAETPMMPWLIAGIALVLVGFGFKVALVPFHMWTPDVYEGAPTQITGLMAGGVKAAGFAAFFKVFLLGFGHWHSEWSLILGIFAIATMTLGNLAALAQSSIKRMLAYSSVAHAGYILLGLVAAGNGNENAAAQGILFYLLAYIFMTVGSFTVVFYVETTLEGDDKKRFSGLGWNQPFVGAAMALFLLSLAGIPPTAGFMAKFYVFSAAIQGGFVSLVILAVINSLISLYYYLKPLVWMYMVDTAPQSAQPNFFRSVVVVVLFFAFVATLTLGIFPSAYSQMARFAGESLLPLTSLALH